MIMKLLLKCKTCNYRESFDLNDLDMDAIFSDPHNPDVDYFRCNMCETIENITEGNENQIFVDQLSGELPKRGKSAILLDNSDKPWEVCLCSDGTYLYIIVEEGKFDIENIPETTVKFIFREIKNGFKELEENS